MTHLRFPLALVFALALVAAACTTEGGVSVESGEGAATDAADEPAGAAADEPTEEPEEEPTDEPVEEPTEEPTSEAVEEPTEEPTSEAVEEPTEEPTDEPDDAASAFASSLDDDALGGLDDDTGLCIGIEMVDRFGGAKVIEMADDDYIPTSDEVTELVDSLYSCASEEEVGEAFTSEVFESIGSDLPAESVQCVADIYSSRSSIEEILQLYATYGDVEFEELPADGRSVLISPFFDCVGFGTILASVAADDGVVLGDDSIACLDENGAAFLELVLTLGDLDSIPASAQGDLIDTIFSCLSAEELGEFAG